MSLASFLTKYAGEAESVASALGSIISGIALPSDEKANVTETIEKLSQAAKNILDGIGDVENPVVNIDRADIEAAVKTVIDGELSAAIDASLQTVNSAIDALRSQLNDISSSIATLTEKQETDNSALATRIAALEAAAAPANGAGGANE